MHHYSGSISILKKNVREKRKMIIKDAWRVYHVPVWLYSERNGKNFGRFTFEVMDCDNRRVDKVLVTEGEE